MIYVIITEKALQENYMIQNKLDQILKTILEAIENSKDEIYDIAEHARKEYQTLEQELLYLKEQTILTVGKVDELQRSLMVSRKKLAEINKNFNEYSQTEMKKIYQETDSLRVSLAIEKEREQFLLQQRNNLEIRLKASKSTVEKAENLMNHVGVAFNFLSGDLKQLSNQVEDLKSRQLLGIKVLKAQEEERKRVAREIHDGPAQSMANVILKIDLCEKLMGLDVERSKVELKNLKQLVRMSIQDVRRIIYDLRPMALDDLGIVSTLERYIKNYELENKLPVQFIVKGIVVSLENIVSLTLFRIVQEALNNIKKHAEAHQVAVTISYLKDAIEVVVVDDGKGFDIQEVKKTKSDSSSGFGLDSIRERVEILNGKLKLRSEIGKGTRYYIWIPVGEEGVKDIE